MMSIRKAAALKAGQCRPCREVRLIGREKSRHCVKRSDEAIYLAALVELNCFVAMRLAMTASF